ncbi:hypothetical protein MA03_00840 [Infirmifilum uzonense]|uniref:Calcineurin-like phosphoesterase domain-containing protein n=1 Tax=Infirmifilum uzonense TaxID=1550241 RepID=A0A0F7FGA9_9CREN|nr:hypothetical protein MA03_00840 [Infirmifilum uzonense]
MVAGDLFEDLHYRISTYQLKFEILKLGLPTELPPLIIYTPSFSSHDPIVDEGSINLGRSRIYIRRVAHIQLGDDEVVVTHGDIGIANGAIAHLVDRVGSLVGRKLLVEEKVKEKLNLRNQWLIMGHTHIPGLDTTRRIGNPGSWKSAWGKWLPYWRKPTYSLIFYDGKSFRLVYPLKTI